VARERIETLAQTLQRDYPKASACLAGQLGAETVVRRLADILLVHAIRAHLTQGGNGVRGWLRALLDSQISEALAIIHKETAEPWTVESLASRVAMSRSAFAERFSTLVGVPPLTYLTRLRMHHACHLLATTHLHVKEIAAQVGYDTEGAFHKTFKRTVSRQACTDAHECSRSRGCRLERRALPDVKACIAGAGAFHIELPTTMRWNFEAFESLVVRPAPRLTSISPRCRPSRSSSLTSI